MQRIKCTISYDGTEFLGYQIQPKGRTVQEEIEKALNKLHKGTNVKIFASGRTDAGVHAKGQVIHFDTNMALPVEKWLLALNSLLPGDISILDAELVDSSFHARFDAKGKEYRFFINPSLKRDPFSRNYAVSFPFQLDLEAVSKAMYLLKGTHDYTSFCSAKTEVDDKVRTVYELDFYEENGFLVFRFVGSGFLYNMVRIMTGTLLEVGSGKRDWRTVSHILEKKDRTLAGKTAPGHGLYLWKVLY